ncbi:MAG: DUF2156 domain-containing protein [Lachnospiraceae bacterium]|nr:DUF2156 domain-containing protein [Lachnospiraceae bacterium]
MSEFEWKEIKEEDEELFQEFYEKEQSRSCEHSFANNLLWSPFYGTKYCIIDGSLVFKSGREEITVSFPIGRTNTKRVVDKLISYFEEKEQPFCMHLVTPEQFERLEQMYPGRFQIRYERDAADYVYESEKLISLAGKKLHGKRNHINNFIKNYPDYQYERITEKNKEECLAMAQEWRVQNGCDSDPEKSAEFCVTLRALKELEQLQLVGGLIRAGGKVVAFSIGEKLCDDTFVVHIEKAYADIQGAYPMINQQFVLHEASEYTYINREEDTGAEGLRKAKLSYYPAFLQEKGTVTFK